MPVVLTPDEQKAYYASERPKADPVSPTDWKKQQNPADGSVESPVQYKLNSDGKTYSLVDTGKTVYSDVNIRENVIPDLKARADKIAETGQYVDNQGNLRNSDGTIAEDPEVKKLQDEAKAADDDIQSTLDNLRAVTDADTKRQIDSIKAQFAVRRDQQKDINMRLEAGVDTALLLGGSSRYAVSSNAISAAQERAGVMELSNLDAQEQSAIASVKAAQAAQDWKIMEKELDRAEEIRAEKTKRATELAASLADSNRALRESQIKLSREMAITDLFTQGVSDPATMQQILNYDQSGKQVGDVSLEEIQAVLNIVNPSNDLAGLSTDYRTFKAMQDRKEIPEDWTLFDYVAAVGNASRKPETQPTTVKPSFEEWKASAEGQKAYTEALGKQPAVYTPAERERRANEELQSVYESSARGIDPKANYSAATIPDQVRSELLDDISKGAELSQLFSAYPDVSTDYIKSLFGSLNEGDAYGGL